MVFERSKSVEVFLKKIILVSILQFTLFCCNLVFAVNYALLVKRLLKKSALVKKILKALYLRNGVSRPN